MKCLLCIALGGILATGCGGTVNPKPSGITIVDPDPTAPGVGLMVDPEFGPSIAVTSDGRNEATTILRRTGRLSFLVWAKDSESGVRRLELWMTDTVTTCDAGGICAQRGPGLPAEPRFTSDFGEKNPGELTSESALMAQELQVESEIGQKVPPVGGSLTVTFEFWAFAKNHRGGVARTAIATATFRQQG